jgi:conjugative transposon TraK protein
MRLAMLTTIIVSGIIICFTVIVAYIQIENSRQRIYVLDKGNDLVVALGLNMQENRPAEARAFVRSFHELFYSLYPDNGAINDNINRALYLGDKSIYDIHNNRKESGYYRKIIAANARYRIKIDSVIVDMDNYPYTARCVATQAITRESKRTVRLLVTSTVFENTGRSDNNPQGFLITRHDIMKNEDIETENLKSE